MSDFLRVGDILGRPAEIDASRPNTMGRATPHRECASDFPMYRTYKACRGCHRNYEGWSFLPQYDDDEIQAGWCDRCVNRITEARRQKFLEEDAFAHQRQAPRPAISAPASRVADPLAA